MTLMTGYGSTMTLLYAKPTVCVHLIAALPTSALDYEGCSIPLGMSSETLTRKRRDEVYNGLKTSLEIMASVAKMSPVPGLEGIIGTVTSIMDIVEVSCFLTIHRSPPIAYHHRTLTRGRNTTSKLVMTSALKSTNSLTLSMSSSRNMMILQQIRE